MPVPPYQDFIDPLLRVLAESPDGLRASVAHEAVASRLGLSDADKAELLPSGQQPMFKNRNGWAHDRLKRAGLSESSAFGTWRLTKSGAAFVKTHPKPLRADEIAKITDVTEKNQAVVWKDRLDAFRADTTSASERDATKEIRNQIRPLMREVLRKYLRGVEASLRRLIQERLTALNERIEKDSALGPGFRIGHSYFCQRVDAYDEAWFRRIIDYEIVPLLREYWFDSPAKLDEAIVELRGG
ncbi:MAG TPA: winged helix-turn-helix domain-containing protein [Polyangium sp.]|nr:winged helix-turn-helix domain-containing protein [Polyangium sp.]